MSYYQSGERRLHCPECGSTELSVLAETTINGGSAVHTPVAGRIGMSTYKVSNTHRNYWMCHKCGNKFRNLQNLKEEIKQETTRRNTGLVCAGIFAALTILCIFAMFSMPEMILLISFPVFMLAILVIAFLGIGLSGMANLSKLCKERDYLEARCFD